MARPADLGLRFEACPGGLCVSYVMPASHAWLDGATAGMSVRSIDGRAWSDYAELPLRASISAELTRKPGEELRVPAGGDPVTALPNRYSLWCLAGVFSLLGSAVILRRSDLRASWLFGLFAAMTAVALAVGPAAAEPKPRWALVVQFVSLSGVGAFLLPTCVALLEDPRRPPRTTRTLVVFLTGSGFLLLIYAASLLVSPTIYSVARAGLGVHVAISVIGSVAFLGISARTQPSAHGRQRARLVLFGVGLGALPFVSLSFLPAVLGGSSVPSLVTVPFLGFIPAAFAYAILQYQLLGIRRLIHRGMVYGTASMALLAVISMTVMAATSLFRNQALVERQNLLIAVLVLLGVVLFSPLQRWVRRLLDKLFYGNVVDYQNFIESVGGELLASRHTGEVARLIAERLVRALRLESAVLLLGDDASRPRTIATAGERGEEMLQHFRAHLAAHLEHEGELVELQWESNSLILATLSVSGRTLGHLLLGPREAGEVFVEEEKQVVATVTPILALALDKSELSDGLRELNRRLVKAEETERARIARDLHDGPLQRAVILAGGAGSGVTDPQVMAQQLVAELREVCSRLRPAILDDLGLIPALEWLLDAVSRRSKLSPHLALHNLDEEDRFAPDTELVLFRVTQEAVNNVVKHAGASSLEVSLTREDHSLILRVADDGVGLAPDTRRTGLGIPGMRERVTQVDGAVDFQSAPGEGTTVIARVPEQTAEKNR